MKEMRFNLRQGSIGKQIKGEGRRGSRESNPGPPLPWGQGRKYVKHNIYSGGTAS